MVPRENTRPYSKYIWSSGGFFIRFKYNMTTESDTIIRTPGGSYNAELYDSDTGSGAVISGQGLRKRAKKAGWNTHWCGPECILDDAAAPTVRICHSVRSLEE